KDAVKSPAWEERRIEEVPKRFAVTAIRQEVFRLAGGNCKYCNKFVPFYGDVFQRGHLHEEIHRGEGGEISVYNSTWACFECHKIQHPEKMLRFGCSTKLSE